MVEDSRINYSVIPSTVSGKIQCLPMLLIFLVLKNSKEKIKETIILLYLVFSLELLFILLINCKESLENSTFRVSCDDGSQDTILLVLFQDSSDDFPPN